MVVDRVLEVFDRRGLSPCELRVLFTLLDREASLAEIAEALGKPASEVTRAGRRLATRGLVRWYHVGAREETRLVITARGLATMRALLAAAENPEPREFDGRMSGIARATPGGLTSLDPPLSPGPSSAARALSARPRAAAGRAACAR
jgi:DNA-binding MarR family transcriptional regulator